MRILLPHFLVSQGGFDDKKVIKIAFLFGKTMKFHFDVKHAEVYGLEEAIMIENLRFWIKTNKAAERNVFDGKVWTYNSAAAFAKVFTFWNRRKIERILHSLVAQGVLLKANYNRYKYDRSSWYSFVDEEKFLSESVESNSVKQSQSKNGKTRCRPKSDSSNSHTCLIELPKMGNGFPDGDPPIPDSNPDSSQNHVEAAVYVEAINYIKTSWKRSLLPYEKHQVKNLLLLADINRFRYAVDESVLHNILKLAYIRAIVGAKTENTSIFSKNENAIDIYLRKHSGDK